MGVLVLAVVLPVALFVVLSLAAATALLVLLVRRKRKGAGYQQVKTTQTHQSGKLGLKYPMHAHAHTL